MADKSKELVLEALTRAAARPGGLPLWSSRSAPGWFANTPAGKQAAELCQRQDLCRFVGQATQGKKAKDLWALSEQGRRYLRSHLTDVFESWNGQHGPDYAERIVVHLADWKKAGALGDCPLPELFRRVAGEFPQLTIGQFQDALRDLHDRRRVYLHPWSGPLYQVPEPAFALLAGHEVAYYASLHQG